MQSLYKGSELDELGAMGRSAIKWIASGCRAKQVGNCCWVLAERFWMFGAECGCVCVGHFVS